MTFIDRLREYLRRAASSPIYETPLPDHDTDIAVYRKHLLDRLESLEQQLDPVRIRELHTEWSNGDRLASFVRAFTADHVQRFGQDTITQPLQMLVKAAIDSKLGLPVSGPLAWQLELQGAVARAWLMSFSDSKPRWDVKPYALEVRAVRVDHEHRITPTAIGRVTLELTGIDVIRWLLQVEAEQSIGWLDPWRLSRATAALLVAKRRDTFFEFGSNIPSVSTLSRLKDMGVLNELFQDKDRTWKWTYAVRDAAVPILEEIAGSTDTPLRVLAATLLSDDRNSALARAQPKLANLFGEEAASASIRQARLVAHEVRNSLVPVQVALEELFHDLSEVGVDRIDLYRGRIDDGVNRIFKFVDETLRVLTIAAEPAEAFDVSSTLWDALGSFTQSEAEVTQTIPAPGELPPIVGARSRFVLAIVNVVRNAVQSTPGRKPSIAVAAAMAADARSIVITIDDDGPGVPAAHREAIFSRGISLRPGGTGMGLALTREVVQRELGGRVTCAESPLGGARFEIVLPIHSKGAS